MGAITLSDESVLLDKATQKSAQDVISRINDSSVNEIIINVGDQQIQVGHNVTELVMFILNQTAQGGRMSITTMPQELTTTVAAHILGISRPTLMKKIRDGELEAIKVGSHHRIKLAEVERFKEKRRKEKRALLREMDELADQLEDSNNGN